MPNVPCDQCGKEFHASPSRLAAGARYCSRACYQEANKRMADGECAWCGKAFKKQNSRQKHCSTDCARSAQQEAARNTVLAKQIAAAKGRSSSGFGLFDDPWTTGDVKPDRYGRDLYRTPDFGLGF